MTARANTENIDSKDAALASGIPSMPRAIGIITRDEAAVCPAAITIGLTPIFLKRLPNVPAKEYEIPAKE